MSAPNVPSGWRVTSTAETTDANEQGGFVKGVQVTFVTGKGHQGSVFLPVAAATPAAVRAAIDARAVQLDAIAALTADDQR